MHACVIEVVWLTGIGWRTCMVCDVGYACRRDLEITSTVYVACADAKHMYICARCT